MLGPLVLICFQLPRVPFWPSANFPVQFKAKLIGVKTIVLFKNAMLSYKKRCGNSKGRSGRWVGVEWMNEDKKHRWKHLGDSGTFRYWRITFFWVIGFGLDAAARKITLGVGWSV